MSEFWSGLLQAVLVAAVSVLSAAAVAYVRAKIAEVKNQYPTQWDQAQEIVSVVVRAAEQMGLGGVIDDKLDYALDMAEAFLSAKGIHLDLDQLRALIEAEVNREFGKPKIEPGEPG